MNTDHNQPQKGRVAGEANRFRQDYQTLGYTGEQGMFELLLPIRRGREARPAQEQAMMGNIRDL